MSSSATVFIVAFSTAVKCWVATSSYSGKNKPPMYGDFEAQRHWMEVTYHLPVKDWYWNTAENNLTYWGLDYPPLTAYHSWIMGWIAHTIEPAWVALGSSHGHESVEHKIFMRMTVIISDILHTAGLCWYMSSIKAGRRIKFLSLALLFPGLILIDHGHFQYNCVSLGLTVFAVSCILFQHELIACSLFVLALCYKQISLYFALPFFFYFLGKIFQSKSLKSFIKIGVSVLFTFFIVWLPFLNSVQLPQVVHRIFPLARGVFEDKVSNMWCLVNILFKLRAIPNHHMAIVCTVSVILACFPSCIDLFCHPIRGKFLLSLVNSSLAFFLFSFQVHEKSILFVATAVILSLQYSPVHCCWLLHISTLSMTPLLFKDGLFHHLLILSLFYLFLISRLNFSSQQGLYLELPHFLRKYSKVFHKLYLLSLGSSILLSLACVVLPTPIKYPHLYPLLISAFSAVHFVYFLLFFNYSQLMLKGKKSQ